MARTLEQLDADEADFRAARRFASTLVDLLDDYIARDCRRAVYEKLTEAAMVQGFELTSKAMRMEYEAWKKTQVDIPIINAL